MKKSAIIAVIGFALVGCSNVGVGGGVSVGADASKSNGSYAANSGTLVGFTESVEQFGQAAKRSTGIKPLHVRKLGIDFKRGTDGIAFINGKPASNDENNANASVYHSGLISVIVYKKNGKINAMEDGKFLGRLN
ncbi:hypothetical protein NLN92_19015 [Citrobacter portucalensis]|uniref:hypothetical protein n=1 Tax=Citrobacter portucalensis TaxID=1639133 RepID=UPI00226BAF4B|nr:hypothetical protein [Citrobacter portucalensis]MCX8980098.1 hypothetical protein [Citrobacter portucalensis]